MDKDRQVNNSVELFEYDLQDDGRNSSKGNQLKWKNNDIWYKADYLGYEGLAEYVVSNLLIKSTLRPDEYVIYEPINIKYKSIAYTGCKSKDFTNGFQITTLERLFKNQFGDGLNKGIYSIADHKNRLEFIVAQVERVTGIKDFGIYMNKLLTIDALFLNEDRHTHNISVMIRDGRYSLCPIYDNGASLLSDIKMDYPLNTDIYDEIKNVKPKTFSDSFDEQLELSETLYGNNLYFNFTDKDIDNILFKADIYSDDIKKRVKDIIIEQKRKYSYLFKK